ncbi:MAG: exodeoxyribonuclease III [Gammaproteobacteria bacterium]|nr:exodeoxyribonuclease III [Gammaproteobacteria bacterium]
MKIASWNVNSIKVRAPHVLAWLQDNPVNVLGLQELKLPTENFPYDDFEQAGYKAWANGQKTYNGVALIVKQNGSSMTDPADIVDALPNFKDEQRRVIALTVGDLRIINLYVPNGQEVGSEKFEYKLSWLKALREWLAAEKDKHANIAVMGDFNIAPKDDDVHDPEAWRGRILFSEPEHQALAELQSLDFNDSFRLFDQAEKTYSWWDYRLNAFKRKMGMRIDLILTNQALSDKCTAAGIDSEPRGWERPSDHAPVWAQFDFES